jgi:hypothetical protein
MDSLKNEFSQYRGCLIFLGVLLLLGLFGGVVQLTLSTLGDFAFLAGLLAVLLGIVAWIGLAKGARWARGFAGILMSIVGLALSIFILFDFGTSLVKGHSLLHTPAVSAHSYGQSVFIILAIGVAILTGGVYLVGSLKKTT